MVKFLGSDEIGPSVEAFTMPLDAREVVAILELLNSLAGSAPSDQRLNPHDGVDPAVTDPGHVGVLMLHELGIHAGHHWLQSIDADVIPIEVEPYVSCVHSASPGSMRPANRYSSTGRITATNLFGVLQQ